MFALSGLAGALGGVRPTGMAGLDAGLLGGMGVALAVAAVEAS